MSLQHETNAIGEKKLEGDAPALQPGTLGDHARGRQFSVDPEDQAMVHTDQNMLHRELKGRHMQMIAM